MGSKKWTAEEDAALIKGRRTGASWRDIAKKFLPGRSGDAASARYKAINLSRSEAERFKDRDSRETVYGRTWMPNEDALILLAKTSGMNWAEIASKYFPTRSVAAIKHRLTRLNYINAAAIPVRLPGRPPATPRAPDDRHGFTVKDTFAKKNSTNGCYALWEATNAMYAREARKTGRTVLQVAMYMQNGVRVDARGVLIPKVPVPSAPAIETDAEREARLFREVPTAFWLDPNQAPLKEAVRAADMVRKWPDSYLIVADNQERRA